MHRPCHQEYRVGSDPGRNAVIRKMARVLETEGFATWPGWKYSPPLNHDEEQSLEIQPDLWMVLATTDSIVPCALEYADGNTDILDALKPSGRYRHEADRWHIYGRDQRCYLLVVCETEDIRDSVESAGIHLPMLTTTMALFSRGPHRGAEAIWRYAGECVPVDHPIRHQFEWKPFEDVSETPWCQWDIPDKRRLIEELAGQIASNGCETKVVTVLTPSSGALNPSGNIAEIRAYVKVGDAGNERQYEIVYVHCESDLPISLDGRGNGGSSRSENLAAGYLVVFRDQDLENALRGPLESHPILVTSKGELFRGLHHGFESVWRYNGQTVNIDHLESIVVHTEPQVSMEGESDQSTDSLPDHLVDEKRPKWIGRFLGK